MWMENWDVRKLKSKKGSGKRSNLQSEKCCNVRRRRNGGKGDVCGYRKAVCVEGVVILEGMFWGYVDF